tara:strand:- start:121 stop:2847 length:2727 start_codon:yes stop_codon:yes gene_type:complete
MSNIKKLMVSAAGGGGVDVDDVFSTYVYKGLRGNISNGIALADGVGGGTSTKFSGEAGNNLRRTSDFSGNSDSNTFTFSAWVYLDENRSQQFIYSADDDTYAFSVWVKSGGDIAFTGWQGTSRKLNAVQSSGNLPLKRWFHVLISIDLSSSSNRYVYINDVDKTSQFSWQTYSNSPIEFTRPRHNIAQQATYAGTLKGNLAHVYLDYTYRNLSTTSNRRPFIDADGGSTPTATLSALNPIMYLPMTEDYSIGENLGTGGDLPANGPPAIANTGTEYLSNHGHGGMVWFKHRNTATQHAFYDTERGQPSAYPYLECPYARGEQNDGNVGLTSFNADGFGFLGGTQSNSNGTNEHYVSWTWRKAPKFFDIVTYTGNNVAGRSIAHDLGCDVGMLIIKARNTNSPWSVWHNDFAGTAKYQTLNSDDYAYTNGESRFGNNSTYINPTSSNFTVGTVLNATSVEYVAYVFAHNDGDGDFGPDGDQDIIKFGSYTGNGSADGPVIDLGFEPQWVMVKRSDGGGEWMTFDHIRGENLSQSTTKANYISVDRIYQEYGDMGFNFLSNGFKPTQNTNAVNTNGGTYIYMAIRRGSLFPPERATEVFEPVAYTGDGDADGQSLEFTDMTYSDLSISMPTNFAGYSMVYNRTSAEKQAFLTNSQLFEQEFDAMEFDHMHKVKAVYYNNFAPNQSGRPFVSFHWKRAPGFFDAVTWSGTNAYTTTINHNLGVIPEMVWIKNRDNFKHWAVYHKAIGTYYGPSGTTGGVLRLNSDIAVHDTGVNSTSWWRDQAPDETAIYLGASDETCQSGRDYIGYFFATLANISKVGSYTGNGSSQTIDCGFSSGARFILVKRTDSTGNWYVWNSDRGIVAGNDPYVLFDTAAFENVSTDLVDPHSSGFIVNGTTVNASGASYIFYAIA